MLLTPPPDISEEDYAAIEEAVMETARGRWFLAEFARRQRAAETQRLADLADRLEALFAAAAQARPAAAIAAPEPALGPVCPQAEEIAEHLDDIVWSMRERGFDGVLCGQIQKQSRAVLELGAAMEAMQHEPVAQIPAQPAPAQPAPAMLVESRAQLTFAPVTTPEPALLARLDAMSPTEKYALFN